MKIRTGFVSNSSSSSFCVYGVYKSEKEIKKALINAKIATEEELKDGIYEYMDAWSYNYKKKNNTLTESEIEAEEKRFFKAEEGWEYNCPYDCDGYIGIPWKKIKDNETGKEFKTRIEKKIKQIFGENVQCNTFEETWRND